MDLICPKEMTCANAPDKCIICRENSEFINRYPNYNCEDVVKVVRCRDCFFSHRDYRYEDGYECEKPLYIPQIGEKPHRKLMQGCDYCSYGVREDGNKREFAEMHSSKQQEVEAWNRRATDERAE